MRPDFLFVTGSLGNSFASSQSCMALVMRSESDVPDRRAVNIHTSSPFVTQSFTRCTISGTGGPISNSSVRGRSMARVPSRSTARTLRLFIGSHQSVLHLPQVPKLQAQVPVQQQSIARLP